MIRDDCCVIADDFQLDDQTRCHLFARSALYVRAHSQNWNVRSFVRSYGFLAIFAKRIWGVDTCRCPSVFWIMNLKGFWKFLKKSARSVHINGICSQEKSGFGSILANFFETLWKRSLWRRLRHLRKAGELESLSCFQLLGVDFMICLGETSASRPCRARCI